MSRFKDSTYRAAGHGWDVAEGQESAVLINRTCSSDSGAPICKPGSPGAALPPHASPGLQSDCAPLEVLFHVSRGGQMGPEEASLAEIDPECFLLLHPGPL